MPFGPMMAACATLAPILHSYIFGVSEGLSQASDHRDHHSHAIRFDHGRLCDPGL